jgi:hypothetical protein
MILNSGFRSQEIRKRQTKTGSTARANFGGYLDSGGPSVEREFGDAIAWKIGQA